jgi:hypothetical protein
MRNGVRRELGTERPALLTSPPVCVVPDVMRASSGLGGWWNTGDWSQIGNNQSLGRREPYWSTIAIVTLFVVLDNPRFHL